MTHSHITPNTFYLHYLEACNTIARIDLLINHLRRLEATYLAELWLYSHLGLKKESYKIYLFGQIDEIRTYKKDAGIKRESLGKS